MQYLWIILGFVAVGAISYLVMCLMWAAAFVGCLGGFPAADKTPEQE